MSASIKVAKVRNKKMILVAIAVIIVIVVASSVAYVVLFSNSSYNNSTDNIQLSFNTAPPSQIHQGSNSSYIVINVNYNPKDHITLTTTGTGASWAYFGVYGISSVRITDGTDSVPLAIYVPNNALTGNYTVQIIGTNSAGITSVPLTYSFSVIV
jgi:uncharacterized membrane protein